MTNPQRASISQPRLVLRLTGLALVLIALASYDSGDTTTTHRLVWPVLMALGAWALVQNLAAVGLGVAMLAGIHARPGAEDWITGIAYPALAALGLLTLIVILARRFKARIGETRDARWAGRDGR